MPEKSIFITATKICCWGGGPGSCASCGSKIEPDLVYEDGLPINYWVGTTWTHPNYGAQWDFCWGCAGLFMIGDYRGAAHGYNGKSGYYGGRFALLTLWEGALCGSFSPSSLSWPWRSSWGLSTCSSRRPLAGQYDLMGAGVATVLLCRGEGYEGTEKKWS